MKQKRKIYKNRMIISAFSVACIFMGVITAVIGLLIFDVTILTGDKDYTKFWICFYGLLVSFIFSNVLFLSSHKLKKKYYSLDRFQKANVAFVMRLLLGTMLFCYTLAADKLLGTLLIVFAYYPMVTVIWCVNSSPGRGGLPWN